MFWSRKPEVIKAPSTKTPGDSIAEETDLNIEPEEIEAPGTPEEVQQYVALCKKVGAETSAVRMLLLEQFMAERGIPDYDPDKVHARLYNLAVKAGGEYAQYCWHPLREQDTGTDFRWYFTHGNRRLCNVSKTVYHELVPASVLETVATILEKFPDAKFFVSDIPDEPDPFLLVTFPGVQPMIVDFWSEPDFRP